MKRNIPRLAVSLALCSTLALASLPASALIFGKDKAGTVKVTRSGPFKGQTTFALGAFRVGFITEDTVAALSKGTFSDRMSASSLMSGHLVGVDHALMQKIADQIYVDFQQQAKAKGISLIDSVALASKSPTYAAMETMTNFDEGRVGTYVIPSGQRSVPLAADGSKKLGKGSRGITDSFRLSGQMMAKAPANKEFPKVSSEVGSTVIGVTIVVNFANFKGNGTSSWTSSAKTRIESGATIEGFNKGDTIASTSIMGWDPKTPDAAQAMAQVALEGQIHSEVSIGELDAHSDMKTGDHIANAIGALGGTGTYNKKMAIVTADPIAYEKNVLLVASQASDILLEGLKKDN